MKVEGTKFTELEKNLGTKISNVSLEEIKVSVSPKTMMKQYADATYNRLQMLNPARAEQSSLSAEKLYDYFDFVLYHRIKMVGGDSRDLRSVRALNVPTWVEFVLSCVGIVTKFDYGLKLVPVYGEDVPSLTFDEAYAISTSLKFFEKDGLTIVQNAFPTSPDGDEDTMSFCIIDDVVMGMTPNQSPLKSYVAAFLGQKLLESNNFTALYRARYDEVAYIATQMLLSEAVWK